MWGIYANETATQPYKLTKTSKCQKYDLQQ